MRWVVVDVEASGLDPFRDRLISIGAVAVRQGTVVLSDGFEGILRQEQVSATSNILVHGIGAAAQKSGAPPISVLLAFLAYARRDPLVAFHAGFDAAMIGRALRESFDLTWKPWFVDLAVLLPALFPRVEAGTLDSWLEYFGIAPYARHHATADAYATAQLFLVALARAQAKGVRTLAALAALEKTQRALRRMGAG